MSSSRNSWKKFACSRYFRPIIAESSYPHSISRNHRSARRANPFSTAWVSPRKACYRGGKERSSLTAPRPDPCGRDSRTRLQPWVCDGETLVRIRMKDSRFGNPVGGQPVHPLPRGAIFLATPPQRVQPNTLHVVVECFQRSSVGRHCVVGEEASDDLLDPSPLLGEWLDAVLGGGSRTTCFRYYS